jgi:hypothetical protein
MTRSTTLDTLRSQANNKHCTTSNMMLVQVYSGLIDKVVVSDNFLVNIKSIRRM